MKPLSILLFAAFACGAAAEDSEFITRMLAYRDLARVTPEKIDMVESVAPLCADPGMFYGPHIKPGIHVYANEVALSKAKKRQAKYRVGALLVKEKFEKKGDSAPSIITVMEKVANDGSVDDWKFTMIRLSDRTIVREGFKRSCVSCHSHYKSTDFVSGMTAQLLTTFAETKKENRPR